MTHHYIEIKISKSIWKNWSLKNVRVHFCNFHNMKVQTFYFDAITDSEFIQIFILANFWWWKLQFWPFLMGQNFKFFKNWYSELSKTVSFSITKVFCDDHFWYHFSKFYSQWYCTLLFRHRNLVDINCFKPPWNVVEENTFKLLPFLWCQE